MGDSVYKSLLEHMNRQPFLLPHPPLKSGIELLEELFSEEEAALILHMSAFPDTVENIAERAKKENACVRETLESLARRGLVFATADSSLPLYGMLPFLPGIYEFQFTKRGTDLPDSAKRIAELCKRYYYEGLGKHAAELYARTDQHTLKARVLSVERAIPDDSRVLPHERVTEIVRSQQDIALIPCYCRTAAHARGEPCEMNAPLDVCLLLGPVAKYALEYGHGKRITPARAENILEQCEEAGLIHTVSNCKEPMVICNCCNCCCGAIKGLTYFDPPGKVAKSRFEPAIRVDDCTGCGECEKRCQLFAIQIIDGTLQLNRDNCIGCGVCASVCPTEAITLVERPDFQGVVHDSYLDLSTHVARSRGLV